MSAGWRDAVCHANALLFDFDGTLAPNLDLPDLRRQVIALTLDRGVPQDVFADQYIVEILDAGAAWLAPRDAAAGRALQADGHRLIREFEVTAARATEPYADARAALRDLQARGKALAVVTRNCREAVLAVFPDLERYCLLLARDDVTHLKPDVRHLTAALAALKRDASRAVMVGDGQLDMRPGKALGLYCVGVLTGSSDRERLEAGGADAVLERAGGLTRDA
jgi:phosphoglycolate phosphatase